MPTSLRYRNTLAEERRAFESGKHNPGDGVTRSEGAKRVRSFLTGEFQAEVRVGDGSREHGIERRLEEVRPFELREQLVRERRNLRIEFHDSIERGRREFGRPNSSVGAGSISRVVHDRVARRGASTLGSPWNPHRVMSLYSVCPAGSALSRWGGGEMVPCGPDHEFRISRTTEWRFP